MNNDLLKVLRSPNLYDPLTGRDPSKPSNNTMLSAANNAITQAISAAGNTNAPTEVLTTEESVSTPGKSLWDLSTEIIQGKYGNGKARQNALEKEGYNYHQVQDFVNKRIWGQLSNEDYNRTYTNNTANPNMVQGAAAAGQSAGLGARAVSEGAENIQRGVNTAGQVAGMGASMVNGNKNKAPSAGSANVDQTLVNSFLDALRLYSGGRYGGSGQNRAPSSGSGPAY